MLLTATKPNKPYDTSQTKINEKCKVPPMDSFKLSLLAGFYKVSRDMLLSRDLWNWNAQAAAVYHHKCIHVDYCSLHSAWTQSRRNYSQDKTNWKHVWYRVQATVMYEEQWTHNSSFRSHERKVKVNSRASLWLKQKYVCTNIISYNNNKCLPCYSIRFNSLLSLLADY